MSALMYAGDESECTSQRQQQRASHRYPLVKFDSVVIIRQRQVEQTRQRQHYQQYPPVRGKRKAINTHSKLASAGSAK